MVVRGGGGGAEGEERAGHWSTPSPGGGARTPASPSSVANTSTAWNMDPYLHSQESGGR